MFDLRTQYLARFGALAGVQSCEAHDGEFDSSEVARLGAAKTPAIYVACMGESEVLDETGETGAVLTWLAMVVARGPDGVREGHATGGDVAAALALRIVAELSEGDSFPAARTRPAKVRSRNLYGSDAARKGYRLWAVSWEQAATIRPDELEPVLHDYARQHTEYPNLPDGSGDPTAVDVELQP